jgi:hypothetical protein
MNDKTTEGYEATPDEVEGMLRNLCAYALSEPDPLERYVNLTHQQVLFDGLVAAIRRERGKALHEMMTMGAPVAKVAEVANLESPQRVKQLITGAGLAVPAPKAAKRTATVPRQRTGDDAEPPAARSGQVEPAGPVPVEPARPVHVEPARSVHAGPPGSVHAGPLGPVHVEPARPVHVGPSGPVPVEPARPVHVGPSGPVHARPSAQPGPSTRAGVPGHAAPAQRPTTPDDQHVVHVARAEGLPSRGAARAELPDDVTASAKRTLTPAERAALGLPATGPIPQTFSRADKDSVRSR